MSALRMTEFEREMLLLFITGCVGFEIGFMIGMMT